MSATAPAISLEAARDACWSSDSYKRLGVYFDIMPSMEPDDWLRLLGEIWPSCDNIGLFHDELSDLLPDRADRRLMTDEEWEAYQALTRKRWLRIYRGALEGINEHGLSWTRSRPVAAAFPRLLRYRAARLETGDIVHPPPVLITASVRPRDVLAVKLDRGEEEIIARCYRVCRVERLPAAQEDIPA